MQPRPRGVPRLHLREHASEGPQAALIHSCLHRPRLKLGGHYHTSTFLTSEGRTCGQRQQVGKPSKSSGSFPS